MKMLLLRFMRERWGGFLAVAVALLFVAGTARAGGDDGSRQSAGGEEASRRAGGEQPPSELPPDLQREVDGIQSRYEKLEDFKARFVQESRLDATSEPRRATGEVFYQKPGRMRWRYESPDSQEILIRDGKFWQYVPADKQVVIQAMDVSRVEYVFLTGLGELKEQFEIRWDDPRRRPGSSLVYLALVPRDKEASFAGVILGVDEKHRILVTEVKDFLGNVTILRFEGLKDNVGVASGHFQWKSPAGADVIDMTTGFREP